MNSAHGKKLSAREIMKDTGLTQTIDEYGRVLIPKVLRRELRIKEGCEFDIFVDGDSVIFKKTEPLTWESIPGDGFNHGWRCPRCKSQIWLPLGEKPEDHGVLFCSGCGKKIRSE